MRINRNGLLFKYAYFWSDKIIALGREEDKTNLCSFFWRCFLLQPLKVFIAGVFLYAAFSVLYLWPTEAGGGWRYLIIPGAIAFVFGLIMGIMSFVSSDFWEFIKGNYCPAIYVEDSEEVEEED